ncbi:MAG: ABC transporter permease [Cyclobacteriaceae bacterium]
MFNFNPVLTFRNLLRHKSTSFINIFGFTLGLVASIFLYFYIFSELSYDSFHKDKDQIYRAVRLSGINGSPYSIGVSSGPYARALKNDFPEDISAVTRAQPDNGLVSFGEKKFFEEKLLFADANFFEFFSFPLSTGNPGDVLKDANSAVLTKSAAQKYFGDQNPLGQIIEVDNRYQFTVTGIMSDFPAKSSLEFDMVFSLQIYERFEWFSDWWNNGLITYVNIPTPEQANRVIGQLPGFMDKYFGEDFEKSGTRVDLTLEPLSDLYFNNETRYDFVRHGDLDSIFILALVAISILFIACFNYVNLSIAQSFMRAKEVGVRKVLGVPRFRLVSQFLGESLMILFFSVLLSVGICHLLNPVFNSSFGLDVVLDWTDSNVLVFFFGLVVTVLITSGIYPAVLLSSFKPISVLKGSKLAAGKNVGLRKGLVILQFSISIFLIVATFLISAQTDFLNSKDLGFDKEAVVVLDLNNSEIRTEMQSFKDRLLANSNVKMVSGMSGEPGGFHDASGFIISGIEGTNKMRTVFADRDYLELFGIEMVAGRNFSNEISSDEENVMIFNEKAVKDMGLNPEDLVGRKATMPGWGIDNSPIIGVVKDFHFKSLKDEIEPLAIISNGRPRRLAIKVNEQDIANTLLFIDDTYKAVAPNFPISYQFLDQNLERLYEDELKQAKVFTAFSGISILLACLGIFGLAAYSAQQRQKELGIRKVLGATPKQIINLISREFIILVLIATAIASPTVWYFIKGWLGNFAYRIDIPDYWYIFVLGGLIAVVIALLTIIVKTYRAAVSDPTQSIRNE